MSMTQTILKWLERGSGSPAGKVTYQDVLKAARGAGINALATWLIFVLQKSNEIDLGPYQGMASSVTFFVIDYLRRLATDNTQSRVQ